MNFYEDRFQELQRKNEMIKRQVEIIQENRKPIIPEIYPELPLPIQDEQQPQDIKSFLKNVEQQRKQINTKIEQAQKSFEKQQKDFENKQKKKQSKIQQNKVIPSKDQLKIERQQKEDARLNAFIKQIVDKYGQYLQNEEKELTINQKQEYVQYLKNYEIYQMEKSVKQNNVLALQQKERKDFQLIGNKSQQTNNVEIQMDFIKPQEQVIENKKNNRVSKQIFDKVLIQKILDERCTRGISFTYEQNKDKIIKQIFKYIDREQSGYISKEELLEYFNKFQVFIDVIGLIPKEFQTFVKKVKAIRRGLLNIEEFKQIIEDPKLHDQTEIVQKRIQNMNREQYLIPNKDDHLYKNEDILIGNTKEQFIRDPQLDYKQLEEVQDINQQYQDIHFPLKINPNVEQMKIVVEKEKKNVKQKLPNYDFVRFSNQIFDLQNAYKEGKLDAQKYI